MYTRTTSTNICNYLRWCPINQKQGDGKGVILQGCFLPGIDDAVVILIAGAGPRCRGWLRWRSRVPRARFAQQRIAQ